MDYRRSNDDLTLASPEFIPPPEDPSDLLAAFLQDEITLAPDRFHLILGNKIENSDYSSLEFLPPARMIFTPDMINSLWAAVS